MNITTMFTAQIWIVIYIGITFAYSAFEKLIDFDDNLRYYSKHFEGTVLEKSMAAFLKLVILLEIATVILCVAGLFFLIFYHEKHIALYGLILAASTLIGLMFGQRIAKDYAGAMNITVYFILTVIGIFILQ